MGLLSVEFLLKWEILSKKPCWWKTDAVFPWYCKVANRLGGPHSMSLPAEELLRVNSNGITREATKWPCEDSVTLESMHLQSQNFSVLSNLNSVSLSPFSTVFTGSTPSRGLDGSHTEGRWERGFLSQRQGCKEGASAHLSSRTKADEREGVGTRRPNPLHLLESWGLASRKSRIHSGLHSHPN